MLQDQGVEHVAPRRVDRVLAVHFEYHNDGARTSHLRDTPIKPYDPVHNWGPRAFYDAQPHLFSDAPARAPKNLDRFTAKGGEYDRALDQIIKARPKQLSAHEVARKVRTFVKTSKRMRQHGDAIRDCLIRALAWASFGVWPASASEMAAQRHALRDQAAFGSLREMLGVLNSGAPELGRGPVSFQVAESAGRTRADWDEIKCQPTHSGGSEPRGIHGVDRHLDAIAAARRTNISPCDINLLSAWLLDPPSLEDGKIDWQELLIKLRIITYNHTAGTVKIHPDTKDETARRLAIQETKDDSDRAIRARLSRLRTRVEFELSDPGSMPRQIADEMAEPLVARPILRPPRPTRGRHHHVKYQSARIGFQGLSAHGWC